MSKMHDLARTGQSIWYDYIRRNFLLSGELKSLISQGLRGLTSNPAVFWKAVAGSSDYDDDLKKFGKEKSPRELYEMLLLKDIATAADLFLPVYESTKGRDGFVSLEVDPGLSNDTEGTVSEAKRLFEALGRPNVMIKVPATPAGIPAVFELIASGVNVNVTLLFSIEVYRSVADAYIRGLETLAQEGPTVRGGLPVDAVSSVASFFLSRVDTAVDRALETAGNREIQGKIGIANAKLAHLEFQDLFSGRAWDRLSARGARVQRLLWAGTATKNPLYPDTLYVDQLIGPDTVTTLTPATLRAFLDHGTVSETLTRGIEEVTESLRKLADLGIDLNRINRGLLEEGLETFVQSFQSMLKGISEKLDRLFSGKKVYSAHLGNDGERVKEGLKHLRDEKVMDRIWAHDYRVWKEDPSEITNRLGWLYSPDIMPERLGEITEFVEGVREEGLTSVLLLGMGGSSLAPETFRKVFGAGKGFLDLTVLDSTDPGAVLACEREHDPKKTLYLVSTKSGGTVETLSFMNYFFNRAAAALGPKEAAAHFAAITDPGSSLEERARKLGFRKVFLNDPRIGGRYSALSFFGLVPAALVGVDVAEILERAALVARNCEGCNCPLGGDNTGARLGAAMGILAPRGRDKLTLITSPSLEPFGPWVEQLIAESTGKEGKGILPVTGEPLLDPGDYSADRLFVSMVLEGDETFDSPLRALERSGHPVIRILLRDLYDLGGEFFRWEMATAVAGHFLGINPFDQPNVESAKVLARKMVADYREKGYLPEPAPALVSSGIRVYGDTGAGDPVAALREFLERADPGEGDPPAGRSYVSIQAFLKPDAGTTRILQELRERIQKTYRLATTLGYGPRFLHSTGQLHKGDAGRGLFIQFTADAPGDAPIPDGPLQDASALSFGTLISAQALGDRQALLDAGRRIIRFHLEGDVPSGLKGLVEGLGNPGR